MEKRFFRRLNIEGGTTIMTKDGFFAGMLENIGMGGLFLKTNKNMEVGGTLEVNVPLTANSANITIAASVVAVRVENNGIAFQFDNLDHKNFWTLLSFINQANA
jgi:Tfp pilus assembly protein PilZ